jgi:chromosomal replication initiator protein
MDHNELWQLVLQRIQIDVSPQTFSTWFAPTKLLEINNNVAKIACKNTFIVQTLETRYYNFIQNIFTNINEKSVDLIFLSMPDAIATPVTKTIIQSSQTSKDALLQTVEENPEQAEEIIRTAIIKSNLNPKYIFETFIVGSSNRLAHAASTAVAEKPGTAYNPLFFYGGVGLGKTHLIQAIGNYLLRVNPKLKVLYTPLETMLNEFIEIIKTGKGSIEFKNKYRQLDVLILDDIQFISGKDSYQEEFFNTFNTLYQANKQIIIASDRPPGEIAKVEDRIRSRLEGGMIADINPPDYETKIAILQTKLEERHAALPEAIIRVIADNVESNVRELEGALAKILTYHNISKTPYSLVDIEKILQRDKKNQKKDIKPRDIIKKVAQSFDVSEEEILGQIRTQRIARARQVAMYLLKKELGITLTVIASYLKRKDHTTVIHGIDKIDSEISKDRDLKDQVSEIRKALSE